MRNSNFPFPVGYRIPAVRGDNGMKGIPGNNRGIHGPARAFYDTATKKKQSEKYNLSHQFPFCLATKYDMIAVSIKYSPLY
jgi:hypothetical protein